MMNYNNPYLNPQAQLNNLVQQFPQYFNQNTQQAASPQVQGLRTLQVTAREEAVVTPVDLSGIPTFFYNKGKDEVYSKQADSAGNPIIKDYALKESVQGANKPLENKIDTKTYDKDFKALNDKIDSLQETFEDYIKLNSETKGGKNAK